MKYIIQLSGLMKRLCMSLIATVCFATPLASLPPPVISETVTFTSIKSLLSSKPIEGKVWIEGQVVAQEDSDLYLIADPTATIPLFFYIEDMAQYTLVPGDHIAAWGSVDKSPLGSKRNEFYVDKLFLMPKDPSSKQPEENSRMKSLSQ